MTDENKTTVDEILTNTQPVEAKEAIDNEPEYVGEAEANENIPDVSSGSDTPKDDYGNEVVKPKTYTEDQVQEMIRERVKRIKTERESVTHQNSTPQQQEQQEADWAKELEGFVKNTIQKISTEEQSRVQRERETQAQAEFESKFATGMNKYQDFADVVKGKPIDDVMVLATRSMKDPAAFLYAAAKGYAKDLERISQIADPYAKVAEIGRLEERMKRARPISNTPTPLSKSSGDIANKGYVKQNVDDLILKDAQKKFSNRRF